MKALSKFKSVMKPYKVESRSSTISIAFAQDLAPADEFNVDQFENAFRELGLIDENDGLRRAYCNAKSSSSDHLNPLVSQSKFTITVAD